MNRFISISCLCLFIVFSISCKKDHASNPVSGNPTIVGSWEHRRIDGVQNPDANPNYPAGNGTSWKFTATGYEFYVHGQLTDSGLYIIIQAISPVTGQPMKKLIFNSNYSQGLFFQISSGTLIIYRGLIAADGDMEYYISI